MAPPWTGELRAVSGRDGRVLERWVIDGDRTCPRQLLGLGDRDHDGCLEFAVGVPRSVGGVGSVHVLEQGSEEAQSSFQALFPRKDGGRVDSIEPTSEPRRARSRADSSFGSSIVRWGDRDGDGFEELAVASPWGVLGEVLVLSGRTLGVRGAFGCDEAITRLGPVHDLDGDGRPELLASSGSESGGALYVLSESSRAPLCARRLCESDGAFGQAGFRCAWDLPEVAERGECALLVLENSPLLENRASWTVLDGPGLMGTHPGSRSGRGDWTVDAATVFDVNGDHVDDIALLDSVSLYPEHYVVRVISGRSVGVVLRTVEFDAPNESSVGMALVSLGDFDGDGAGDFAIVGMGAGEHRIHVRAHSGRDGQSLLDLWL